MDERFQESFLHVEHTVYGRTLRPLSLLHWFLLESVGSPYPECTRSVDWTDLALAVSVCTLKPGAFLPNNRTFRGRLTLALDSFRFRRFRHHFVHEHLAFTAYLADHMAFPRMWSSQGDPLKAPPIIAIVTRLMHWGHMNALEAWSQSPGAAVCYQAALAEASGSKSNLFSEADAKALREAGYDV